MKNVLPVVLGKLNLTSYSISGISVVTVSSEEEGKELALEVLDKTIDRSSVLYLSGGRTPKSLYQTIAKTGNIKAGTVSLVDERYGKSYHENSNELMLKETGILDYFEKNSVPFFKILEGKSRQKTTEDYDQKLREFFVRYKKHAAILGVGLDGHTAGIPSDPGVWQEFDLATRMKTEMAIDYDDHGKFYNERISMSFLALSRMDLLLVLVFGQDKRRALEWMFAPTESGFADGSEDEVPARFLKRPEIASKTILLTDQTIGY